MLRSFLLLLATHAALGSVSSDFPYHPDLRSMSVDLHAHLFMKQGIGWIFRGDFSEPLQAKTYRDGFSSQANADSVNQSNIGVLVVSIYTHPLFKNMRESVVEQVERTKQFVAANPNWMIALSPDQAEEGLKEGKRIIVLSLEGAAGIADSERDLFELKKLGIRIITLFHFTDDAFGGAAFLPNYRVLLNPIAWMKSLFSSRASDILVNSQGLTQRGKDMMHAMIDRKIWVDFSHASDRSHQAMVEIYQMYDLPVLHTHTMHREIYPFERGASGEALEAVVSSRGMIGVMPSEDYLSHGPHSHASECYPDGQKKSVEAFSEAYNSLSKRIPSEDIVLGSDTNGAIPHLAPSCGTSTSLDENGYWNIGQTAELWSAAQRKGATIPEPLGKSIQSFVEKWKRVWNPQKSI